METDNSNDDYEVLFDGRTVWVNGSDGCAVGRFGALGIDIHRSPSEMMEAGTECLYCTHGSTTLADWEVFVSKMSQIFGVTIPPEAKPSRLLKRAPIQELSKDRNVHTEHCCKEHGCKYGDSDCPVDLGLQSQSFPCEMCDESFE